MNAFRIRKGTVPIGKAQILFFRADSHRKNHHISRKSEKFQKIAKKAPNFDFALAKNIAFKIFFAFADIKNIQYFDFWKSTWILRVLIKQ
jgi:hypothetical protein